MLYQPTTLNCLGQLLSLEEPIVMGILNVTPDSFFDGGKYNFLDAAFAQASKMIEEGAAIIDIGGMSSRPGAEIVSVEEELKRVLPIIKKIKQHFPNVVMSIDTVQGVVAQAAIDAGASIINDISAWTIDPSILDVALKNGVPYILMHMQGKPATMQDQPNYQDVTLEVLDFLIEKSTFLRKQGLKDIIIDPGFGFGKSLAQNYELINKLHVFKMLEIPLLVGFSRKSMIYKVLDLESKDSLAGTIALNWMALEQGAKILRVHDVKEAVSIIKIFNAVQANKA